MSFHEKSLWLLFATLLVVFGGYFAAVLPNPTHDVRSEHVGMFVGVVVLLVVIQVVGAIVMAIVGVILSGPASVSDKTDERDRLIELKSTRNGAYVLAMGVFLSLCVAIVSSGNFIFTHVLLFFWVLAQLVETGSQLVHYRRGS